MKSKSKFSWPIFSTQINTDIQSMDDLFKWMNEICDNEQNYTDQELADKLREVTDFRAGNNSDGSIFLTHHYRSDQLVQERARKYCKQHHIKLEDYNGPLPYRMFLIDIFPNKDRDRRLKVERLVKVQKRKMFFNKIKSTWKFIVGKE